MLVFFREALAQLGAKLQGVVPPPSAGAHVENRYVWRGLQSVYTAMARATLAYINYLFCGLRWRVRLPRGEGRSRSWVQLPIPRPLPKPTHSRESRTGTAEPCAVSVSRSDTEHQPPSAGGNPPDQARASGHRNKSMTAAGERWLVGFPFAAGAASGGGGRW